MLSATFEYEVNWQFKALDQNTLAEDFLRNPHQGGYIKIVQREDERAAMAGLMTNKCRSPERRSILEISVWILSGNSHAAQPAERRLGSENRAGDSYVAKSSRSHS